jgi:hypothetical protein
MGYEKDRAIQEDEQGWRFSAGMNVCHRCLSDKDLANFVREHATDVDCDFCGRTTRKPSSVAVDVLMEVIGDVIHQYYDRAVNELGWDGEEQEYVGTTYDSSDIIRDDLGTISENEALLDHLVDVLGDEVWCDRYPYSTVGYDAYETGWERFCGAVKYHTRYFFTKPSPADEHDTDITPVPGMLDEISTMLEEEDLIRTLDTTAVFIRVRVHDVKETCEGWRALGPPPGERAPSSRMSAAGISMFYASTTAQTAKAEAKATLKPGKNVCMTSANWSPTRNLRLLDLCSIRPIPSIWFSARNERDRIRFLHAFTESITQPVVHDGREHIEYVPTQILTEYFHHEYRTHDGQRLDGIIYPSAQQRRGKNVVIFANQDGLTPTAERTFSNDSPLLTLDSTSIKRLRRTRE